VLDIGAGSGRDLDLLIRKGYEACGVEPCSKLRGVAVATFPGLAGRIFPGSLPGISSHLARRFDGVLCAAVFQHVPEEEQVDAAADIRNLLKPNGCLLLKVPRDRPGIDASRRDEHGRLFAPLRPDALRLLFDGFGFRLMETWDDADSRGRPGVSWTTLLFVLRPHDS